jgi:5-methylcytosine-specific restriction endonuclease McrA
VHAKDKDRAKQKQRGKTPVAARLYRTVRAVGAERCAACVLLFPARFLRIDHVVPLADGGRDAMGNLQILCVDCHRVKSSTEASERAYEARERDGRYGV